MIGSDRLRAMGGACAALLAVMIAPATGAASPPLDASASDRLRAAVEAPWAREAIARVAYAEAAGQGDSGLAGVVYTILNRVRAGAWGASVQEVVNAPRQFEPVTRAGGDWRGLPAASAAQRARIDTILNLALEGRLPDLTGGALWFQNPRIVAARAAAGTVSPGLVHFGGARPSVTIGDHAFYAEVAGGAPRPRVDGSAQAPAIIASTVTGPVAPASTPGERGLFVLSDGRVVEDQP